MQLTPFLILWLVHAHAHYKEYDDHDNSKVDSEDDNEEKVRIIMTRIIGRTIKRTILRRMIILQASAVSDLTTAKACLSDPSVSLIHISSILIQPPGPNTTQFITIIVFRLPLAQAHTAPHRPCHQCWTSSVPPPPAPPYNLMSIPWKPLSLH